MTLTFVEPWSRFDARRHEDVDVDRALLELFRGAGEELDEARDESDAAFLALAEQCMVDAGVPEEALEAALQRCRRLELGRGRRRRPPPESDA